MSDSITKKEFLRKVPLFADIDDKETNKIIPIMVEKKYKKDQYLFFENDIGNELFLITSGTVKIFKSDKKTGKIKTLTYLKEGDFFGEMAMLDEEIRSASAQVIEDSNVYILSGKKFKDIMLKNPKTALKITKTLSSRLRTADQQIHDLTFRDLPGRVATTLISLAEKHGKKVPSGLRINVKLTHQELADIVGTAREVVTSILSAFKKANCIEIDEHYIIIIDKDELSTWIV